MLFTSIHFPTVNEKNLFKNKAHHEDVFQKKQWGTAHKASKYLSVQIPLTHDVIFVCNGLIGFPLGHS